jgi:hypothetical protein
MILVVLCKDMVGGAFCRIVVCRSLGVWSLSCIPTCCICDCWARSLSDQLGCELTMAASVMPVVHSDVLMMGFGGMDCHTPFECSGPCGLCCLVLACRCLGYLVVLSCSVELFVFY